MVNLQTMQQKCGSSVLIQTLSHVAFLSSIFITGMGLVWIVHIQNWFAQMENLTIRGEMVTRRVMASSHFYNALPHDGGNNFVKPGILCAYLVRSWIKHPRSWVVRLFNSWRATCSTITTKAYQGLYSLSAKIAYRQMSWSLEAARLDVIMMVSPWNSALVLVKCQGNGNSLNPNLAASRLQKILR